MKPYLPILTLILLVSCGQKSSTESKQEESTTDESSLDGWKHLADKDYSIQYPEDWELNQDGTAGTKFVILSKQKNAEDQFRENVNLIVQSLAGQNIDLDKYTEISEQQIKQLISNSNIKESTRVTTGKYPYQKDVYDGDQGIYKLTFEQYYWVIGDNAYVLTFTAEQTAYDEYKSMGEKIMNTFQIKQ